jgi:hypothetical protein
MKQTGLLLILAIASITLFAGCSEQTSDDIDFGTIRNSVYQNEYFGVSVHLPPEWIAQDQNARRKLQESGGTMLAGDDKNLQAAVKASEMTTVNLLTVFKHPMDKPVPFNPNLICVAERVDHIPEIKKGTDYLFLSKKLLETGRMKVSFPGEIFTESFGGREFGVMHVEISMPGMTVRQKYYAAVMKGYALTFIVSFSTDEEESSLHDILKTMTFK